MTYLASPKARALLNAIRIERPECRYLRRWAWVDCRYPKYLGDNARKLRALWEAECDAAMRAEDHDRYAELVNRLNPDDAIAAMLDADQMQLTECLSDPLRKVA